MKEILGGLALSAAVALFGYAIYNTAWVSDDAYIAFRSADNLVNGHGLTWNTTERVQNFTNPLWVLLHAVPYAIVNDPDLMFYVSIAMSAAVSVLAVLALGFGAASGPAVAAFAIIALTFCRAFVDYSTSGLENPMTHLLLAVFAILVARGRWNYPHLFCMALCAGLAMVNRMDTALLFGPVLAYAWLAERNLRATFALAAGFLPFIAWEVFSVVYYGFPFPNTAYAKLGTGIDSTETAMQGLWYLANSWRNDPLTLFLMAVGLVGVPWLLREGRYTALGLGGLLYVVYVVKVGGDFMQGRFLSAPLFLAVLLITRLPGGGRWPVWIAAAVLAVLVGTSTPNVPILTGMDYFGSRNFKDEHGIGDERKFYMRYSGLKFVKDIRDTPNNDWVRSARKIRAENAYSSATNGAVGFRGFFSGPKHHIIDYFALSDPLLARLPAKYNPDWRIGHFSRHVPKWYEQHIAALAQRLQERQGDGAPISLAALAADYTAPKGPMPTDPTSPAAIDNDSNLKAFYDRIEVIVRGPLWGKQRWKTILDMNLGRYDHLIDRGAYRFPGIRVVALEKLATVKRTGSAWNASGNITFGMGGVEVPLGAKVHNGLIEASLDSNDGYELLFVDQGAIVARHRVAPFSESADGLKVHQIAVPNAAIRNGYDAVRIFRFNDDKRASVGHFLLK